MRRPDIPPPPAAPDTAAQRRAVGTVVAVLDDEVVVNIDGVLRRAGTGQVSRLRIGDWVMVGLGSVVGVVEGARRAHR